METVETKTCRKCGETKPQTEFYPYSGRSCKECVKARTLAWSRAHPEAMAVYQQRYAQEGRLLKVNGVAPEAYRAMLEAQGGHCAICPATEPGGRGRWHIDHDHVTGKVRALLCHCCNTALGLMKDSPELLEKAAAYLRAYREERHGVAA